MAKPSTMPLSYPALLYKHLDRMSELLEAGLDVNTFHTRLLTSYYLGVLHFERMLSIQLDKEYYDEKEAYMKKFPPIAQTWEGNLDASIEFLNATSQWFQLLLLKANEKGMLSFEPKTFGQPPAEEEIAKAAGASE